MISQPAEHVLDHLLLGAPDLDQGIEWIQSLTGISAVKGGKHPGAGTHNALLSLGDRQYLEIIAIDPMQTAETRNVTLIRQLERPGLIAWAAATDDIHALAQTAVGWGFEITGPVSGSRTKPDGETLRWKTLHVSNPFGDIVPFFIEWESGTAHPSGSAPAGSRLEGFEIHHPAPEQVSGLLGKFGIRASVKAGRDSKLLATLSSPKGAIRI